jgi:hypothetical protein
MAQIANGSGNTTPNANATHQTVVGVIASAGPEPVATGSQELIMLSGDTDHMYTGALTGTSFWNDQMRLASPGDTVMIEYVDSGGPLRSITHYSLLKQAVQPTVKPTVTAGTGTRK